MLAISTQLILEWSDTLLPPHECQRARVAEHIRAPLSVAFSLSHFLSFRPSRAGMAQLSSAQRFQFLLVSNFYGWEYDSFTVRTTQR